jgi:hypothetical protein
MINIIAVLIIAAIYFILGALWYSPILFGNIWMKNIGKKPEELKMSITTVIGSVILSILMPLFLAILLEFIGNYDILEGLLISFIIWIGFVITFELYSVLYTGRNFKVYLIDIFYHLSGLLIAGIILGLWKV